MSSELESMCATVYVVGAIWWKLWR